MGKHSKLALFIAPFLMIGGYIASDYWLSHKAMDEKVYALKLTGPCESVSKNCVLSAGDLQINVYDQEDMTWINSTFALDRAVLFLVDDDDKATAYPLGMEENPFYWRSKTPLGSFLKSPGDSYKLRLIAEIKGGKYIGEFVMRNN